MRKRKETSHFDSEEGLFLNAFSPSPRYRSTPSSVNLDCIFEFGPSFFFFPRPKALSSNSKMSSQAPADAAVPAESPAAQTLPDRTQAPADAAAPQGEVSKNAAKKAAKLAKLAQDKAEKKAGNAANKGIGKQEAKKPASKAPKKKIDGAALIGIDVSKEEDFPSWYQQVLTKGDMLDYYDVSGCFILKVGGL